MKKIKKQDARHMTVHTQRNIASAFQSYLAWLDHVVAIRMKSYFEGEEDEKSMERLFHNIPKPVHDSPFERTILELSLQPMEVIVLLLAIVPHLRPQMMDIFFTKNPVYDRGFAEFGGQKNDAHPGFIPTAETAAFVLCGKDLHARVNHRDLFLPQHRLYRLQLLQSPVHVSKATDLGFALTLTPEYLSYFLSGAVPKPEFGPQFPAKLLETKMEWEDLILDSQTLNDLLEIKTWLQHEEELMEDWGMDRMLKPGFRSLFYGTPGTGKSLAAALLGKLTGHEVYRIDLSMVVSKYIGETEKNLASVFDYALEKEWILFFDEADALFGKRTVTSSSNDRYANQEVSYLLQRVEDFPGTVILATNFKSNIDEAFMRRFQSVIQFQKPDRHQRLRLWKNAFGGKVPVSQKVSLEKLATQFELTGGEIVNVLRHAALLAVASKAKIVTLDDILAGIRREFMKDGRMFDSVMD
jgi:hypothetical protein